MSKQIIEFNVGNGLIYPTPPIPSDEKEILYHDLPKKDQYWRTPHDKRNSLYIPSDYEIKKFNEKDRIECIQMWRERWALGMWMFNNGEPVYLNKFMVDHLVFNKFNNRFFSYNESQRDDFYFRELVWNIPTLDGVQLIKPRRYGASAEEITENKYILLSDFNCNIALQSDTLEKAKKTLLLPLIETYLATPRWMREDYYKSNGKRPRSSLELVDVKSDDGEDGISWLGGKVFVYPTNAKAMDGTENMKVTNDELSKYPVDANPRQIAEVNRKTIRNAGRQGKHNLISTTGDSDDVLDSVKEWQKLAAESVYNPITKTTNSGYIKRFVSAIWSQYLPLELLPNKYGKIDVGRNTEWVENEINKKSKGTKEYYYEKRKLPLTEDDALIAATEGTYFRKPAIIARKKYILGLTDNEKPYVRGRLEEKSGDRGAKRVYFEPDPTGLWLIAIHPYVDFTRNIDTRNRFKINDQGVYHPVRNPEYLVTYDPVRYDKNTTKSNHLSRAAIGVWKKFDYFNTVGSKDYLADKPAALFVGREERADNLHKEFCKAMRYYGGVGYFERQVEGVMKIVDSENMSPMILKDPKDNIPGLWQTAKTIDQGVTMLVSRYAAPQEPGDVDHVEENPFEDSLADLENFDRANTTVFDVTMMEIVREHGLPLLEYTNTTDDYDSRLKELLFNMANPERTANARFK